MAHRDWNGDGKINSVDKSLGHHYTQKYSSSGAGGGLFSLIVVIVSFILIFGKIGGCEYDNRPKTCIEFGCDRERTDSSFYCATHWYEKEFKPWWDDYKEENGIS